MTVVTSRRAVQSLVLRLLLVSLSYAFASDSPIFNDKSGSCSSDGKVLHRAERKLAAGPAPEPSVSGNASSPSPSTFPPPSAPPDSRPALIDPSGNTPESDLPPLILSPSPAPEVPMPSPIVTAKKKKLKRVLLLGVALGASVLLIGAIFLAACWLRPRRRHLVRYARHVST